MMGHQSYYPNPVVIVDVDSLIPKNHLLRKIQKVLDLGFIRRLAAPLYCHNFGRPSIDPEVFFRIELLIYFYNIESDRQVIEELHYNFAYRWFCKLILEDSIPEHSSLTRIRNRLGEETFKKIFNRIVRECEKRGLLKSKTIMIDSSLVKADAALNSLVERKDGDTVEIIKKRKKTKYIKGQKFSNSTHVSKTDPDCKLAGKFKEPKLLRYKIHDIANFNSRVILNTHVTDGSVHDGTVFFERIDDVEKTFKFKTKAVVADRGYGFGENLQELSNRKIKSFVPNFRPNVGDNFDPDLFYYDKKKDRFICPMEYFLTPMYTPSQLAQRQQIYRIVGGHCNECSFRALCFKEDPKVNRGKRIGRNLFSEIQAITKEHEHMKSFKSVRAQRQWKMEGLFAEAKARHGLERARYRLRANMQIQAYMIASVQNIKRLLGKSFNNFYKLFIEIIFKIEILFAEFTNKYNFRFGF